MRSHIFEASFRLVLELILLLQTQRYSYDLSCVNSRLAFYVGSQPQIRLTSDVME